MSKKKHESDDDMSDVEDDEQATSSTTTDGKQLTEEEKKLSLQNPLVIEKYKKAAEIANAAVAAVIAAAVPGSKVVELCTLGDKLIADSVAKIYKSDKKVEKGVAFPTCVSINHIVGHFSPLTSDTTTLSLGDVIKIDLGVHIDGFIAVAASTIVSGASIAQPITDKRADVIAAVNTAAEAAMRLIKPGNKNTEVTEIWAKIASDYKVNCVQGVLSHAMDRFLLDGEKVILNRVDIENKVDESEFTSGEIWAIDIVMSSGEGKPKELDDRTTIYKRDPEKVYLLKRQASREVLNEITKRYPNFAFSLRDFNEKKVRFGIVECYQHELVQAYPVLHEKEGDFVAHVKFTVLILPNGNVVRTTQLPVPDYIQSQNKITNADVLKVLAMGIGVSAAKKKKQNKKKKAKKDQPAAAEQAVMDTSS